MVTFSHNDDINKIEERLLDMAVLTKNIKRSVPLIVTSDFFDADKNPPTDKKILDMVQAAYEKMIKDREEKAKNDRC